MSLEDLQRQFRSGELESAAALKLVTPFLKSNKREAERLISEIIGLPAEPQKLSAEDRRAAKAWEKANRSK